MNAHAKQLHEEFLKLVSGDAAASSAAAALLRQSAAELDSRGAAAASPACTLELACSLMDDKIGLLADTLAQLSRPSSPEASGRPARIDLSVDIGGTTSVGSVEEGRPPVSPSPEDLPTDLPTRVMRSLSRSGAEPFVLRAASNTLVVEDSHEMDPALYTHPTPRSRRGGAPPPATPSPKAGAVSWAPAAESPPAAAHVPEAPADERIEELEAENAQLKELLADMERKALLASTQPAAEAAAAAGSASSSLSLTPAATQPRQPSKPAGRMSPRPPPSSDELPSQPVRMHRRGSTTGLMAVNHAPRPSRATQRRMSLKSMLGAQGDAHMTKVEDMVSLLTSISSARDASQLVSSLLHGVIKLGEPDCSSCHLWVSALEKTFSADADGEIDESEGLFSRFMRELVDEPEKTKLNVPEASFSVFSSAATSDALPAAALDMEDGPQSVLALAIFDSEKNLLGVLEVRNAPLMAVARDFGEQDEELLLPIAAQAGVTLANLIYSDKLASTMQDADFSSEDLGLLTTQILASGQEIFGAAAALLALPDSSAGSGGGGGGGSSALEVTFSDSRSKKLARGSTTGAVFSSQMASWVEDVR